MLHSALYAYNDVASCVLLHAHHAARLQSVAIHVAQLRRLSYGEMERCEMTDTLAFSLVLTKPHNAVTRRRKRPQTTTTQRATRWGPALAALQWSADAVLTRC
jgi:hypothetical protein